MSAGASEAFDTRATQVLRAAYPEGNLAMSVQMRVVWAGQGSQAKRIKKLKHQANFVQASVPGAICRLAIP
jgi:hypothetical protein